MSSASSCSPKYFVRPHRITTTFFPFTLGFFWYFFFPIHDCLRRLSHGRFIVAQLLALPFAVPPLTPSRFFRFVVCRSSFRVSAQQSPRRSSFLLSCFCIIVPVPPRSCQCSLFLLFYCRCVVMTFLNSGYVINHQSNKTYTSLLQHPYDTVIYVLIYFSAFEFQVD